MSLLYSIVKAYVIAAIAQEHAVPLDGEQQAGMFCKRGLRIARDGGHLAAAVVTYGVLYEYRTS